MNAGTNRSAGLIQTGVANTASVRAAFMRAGVDLDLIETPSQVASLDYVVLPGVGAFAAGMGALREQGLVEPLRERITRKQPTMLVCLGMQLLCSSSDESHGEVGLDIINAHVGSFTSEVTTPHFGWNWVEPEGTTTYLRPGYAYFANSYRLEEPPDGWRYAHVDHGGRFVAALEHDSILAVQFHPELSGAYGQALIERWLDIEVDVR